MSTSDSIIAYIHGISEHQPGYSDSWHASLEQSLSHSGDDPVTESEFDAWLKSFGQVGEIEEKYSLDTDAAWKPSKHIATRATRSNSCIC